MEMKFAINLKLHDQSVDLVSELEISVCFCAVLEIILGTDAYNEIQVAMCTRSTKLLKQKLLSLLVIHLFFELCHTGNQ